MMQKPLVTNLSAAAQKQKRPPPQHHSGDAFSSSIPTASSASEAVRLGHGFHQPSSQHQLSAGGSNGGEPRKVSDYTLYNVGDPAVFGDKIGGFCGWVLLVVSWAMLILTFPLSLIFCLKVVKEYERAVMFRLGRLVPGGARGPGLFFVMPCIDTYRKVDLRVVSFNVPPQEILSKDSVTVSVDAVVYFRINNPIISVTNVNDAAYSTKLLAQTTLRNVLGTKSLSDMLSEREAISHFMSSVLDEATEPWGVKVERVEVKDIRLPQQLMRAMAAEAEAARDARAKIIAAEGEQKASRSLKEAAEVISLSPAALQLRYLQTLNSIAAEHNSTIVFPLPIDMFKSFMPLVNNYSASGCNCVGHQAGLPPGGPISPSMAATMTTRPTVHATPPRQPPLRHQDIPEEEPLITASAIQRRSSSESSP